MRGQLQAELSVFPALPGSPSNATSLEQWAERVGTVRTVDRRQERFFLLGGGE